MTSRAASTPASESRNAAVSAATAPGLGVLARYSRAKTSVGTAVIASSARKKPDSGSSPSAGRHVAAKRGAERLVADERARARDPEQDHGAGLDGHARAQPARQRAESAAEGEDERAREGDGVEGAHDHRRPLPRRAGGGGAKSSLARSSSSSLALLQAGREDLLRELEELQRPRVLHAVVHVGALAPADDEALLAQRREVLRRAARVELQRLLERSRRCARRRAGAGAAGCAPDGREPGRSRPSARRWEQAASGPALR